MRELREEVSLIVEPGDLEPRIDETHSWEGRQDHVTIFELVVQQPPRLEVDNREVVAAEFVSPEDALKRNLFPPLRRLIEQGPPSRSVDPARG